VNLKLIVPIVLLVAAGAAYKLVLAKPAESQAKVHGQVYVLPKEFVLNLAEARFVKLGVALVLGHEEKLEAHGGTTPPEGYGPLPQEALVRDVITDTLTDRPADVLIRRGGRHEMKEKILKALHKRTDVHVEDVLFTDVAVQ
jgi:flagellar basal body-associated protein FliL